MPSERVQRQIGRLLDEAEAAIRGDDWPAARAATEKVLDLDPDNADATAFLAAVSRREQRGEGMPPRPALAPRAAPLPASFASGRYRVRAFVGQGGSKKVYLAHDTRLDRDVAVAVIEGLDEAGLARVRREARAMGRLGDHPHIVTVFDIGEDGGRPYLVSQYMGGGDLAALLHGVADSEGQTGGRKPISLERAVAIAADIAGGLAHAHSHGIVHRDLKPGNVFLTDDGRACIGDFGLARMEDRSQLTVEGMMVGTFAYMPPEQVMGQPADARSDLYSLGCVLYEMLTGGPPFLGDDAVAVATQHLNAPPVAPSWHNPEVPGALEALVLRLLAKLPEERPQSAAAVRETLASIPTTRTSSTEQPVAPAANPLDRLAAGVFVGREREMGQLRAALDEVVSGHGKLLMLVGEPGIGKTRTALELVTYARLRGAQVLWGRCYEGEGAPPYWPWIQVIRAYVHEREPKLLASEMGPGAADIAEVVSEVRERLPGLPAAPALEPEQARFRLFDSITTFLRNASRRQPLLLVLDDLHWADRTTLQLLLFVAREMRDGRLLVLGTYRDVELGRQHPLAGTLGELAREGLSERVLLRGLGEEDVARFVEMTSGMRPPVGLGAAVFRETEGNPFFVSEVVRLLANQGIFARGDTPGPRGVESGARQVSWSLAVPQGVKEVIGRRLDALSEDCNRVLSVAAAIGREFGLDALERVGEVKGERLLEVLEEATGARMLNEVPGAAGRYSFTHALIWETLYDELSATRRVRLHQRIGDELEALYGEHAEEHAAELAYHFGRAASPGAPEKLVRYATLAGERAARLYAHEEAAAHFKVALAAKEGQRGDDETAALMLRLGKCQVALNELPDAWRNLVSAFEHYAREGEVPEAVVTVMFSHWAFFGPELTRLIERALALAAEGSPESGTLMGELGYLISLRGDAKRGRELLASARDVAGRDGDRLREFMVLRAEGALEWSQGRYEQVRAAALAVVELAAELDMPAAALAAHFQLAVDNALVWRDLGEASRHADADLVVAQRLRLRDGLVQAHYTQGMCALFRGDWDEAVAALDAAASADPADHRPPWLLARMHVLRGDFEAAAAHRARFEEVAAVMHIATGQMAAWLAEALTFESSATGAADVAERGREAAGKAATPPWFSPINRWWAHSALGRLAVMDGDAAAAERELAALAPFSGWPDTGRLMGQLALVLDRLDDAIGHFEAELAFPDYRPTFAEAACDCARALWHRNGPGDRARAQRLLDQSLALARELEMRPLLERAVALKMELQGIDRSSRTGSIDAVTATVQREQPDLSRHAAPDGTVTIMFTDIEGSTALNVELGDDRWMEVLADHNRKVRECIAAHRGFEVKTEGDAFMVAFQSARDALRCAIAIQRAFVEPAEHKIRVRIGLHTGEPVRQGDDFYGTHVTMASRIAASASGGEILISSLLHDLVVSSGEFVLDEGRELQLKGLPGTHRVYPVNV